MYGFKPQHARGKPVQNFADGGIVHSIKGALGFRPRTQEELLADDAKRMANNREAAAAVAERSKPAPSAPQAQQSAVSGYAGMSAMQRREKELGLKDGGLVPRGFKPGGLIRGPGTGTSDSIQAEKRPGTFIMPADSTQAIGPEALEELGEVDDSAVEEQGEKVPVRLSNGEFELPPEQVQALGEAVLTVMRNATHQPAGEQGEAPTGKGFTPHQFFDDGGTVQAAYDDWQSKKQPWYMPTPRGNMEERTAEANYSQALQNQLEPKPAAPPATTTQNATDVRLAAGTMGAPGAAVSGAQPPKPEVPGVPNPTQAQGREVAPGVFNHGKGQYSDDPGGMNMPKGFTGQPSAANNAILQRMSDQSQAESMARVGLSQYAAEVQRAKNINADEAARNNSVGARMQRLADPFSVEGRAMRNLNMDIASSVDRKGKPTGETQALLERQKAMVGGYIAEPMQQATIAGQLQREGMQQAGETGRAGIRAALDQQRINQAGQELGLRTEAAGFQTRAAAQQEELRNTLIDPKATPEQRKQAQEYLQALAVSGKEPSPQYKSHVMPAIRNADGSTTEGGVYQENTRTGEGRWVKPQGDGQAQQGALPKVATPQDLAALKSGTRFVDSNGVERIKK